MVQGGRRSMAMSVPRLRPTELWPGVRAEDATLLCPSADSGHPPLPGMYRGGVSLAPGLAPIPRLFDGGVAPAVVAGRLTTNRADGPKGARNMQWSHQKHCPRCQRFVPVDAKGKFVVHGDSGMLPSTCPLSGKLPSAPYPENIATAVK